jgi:hypothetical protein
MGGLRVDAKPVLEKLPGGGGEHYYLTNQGNLNYFDRKIKTGWPDVSLADACGP